MGISKKVLEKESELRNELPNQTLTLEEIDFLLRLLSMAKFDDFQLKTVEPTYKIVSKLNRRRQQLIDTKK